MRHCCEASLPMRIVVVSGKSRFAAKRSHCSCVPAKRIVGDEASVKEERKARLSSDCNEDGRRSVSRLLQAANALASTAVQPSFMQISVKFTAAERVLA